MSDFYRREKKNGLNTTILRTFFLFLIVTLISIPLILAVDFDNKKIYEPYDKYGKVTIENWFGLGGKIMEVELLENSEYCLVDCYASGTMTLYKKEKFMDSLRFMKGLEEINLDYELYIDGKRYNGQTLQTGTYKWKLVGHKGIQETIDWIPTFLGKEIDEWALWGSAGNLTHYYTFNETSGDKQKDMFGGKNLNLKSAPITSGILAGARYFDNANWTTSTINLDEYSELTMNFWIKKNGTWADNDGLIFNGNPCNFNGCWEIQSVGGGAGNKIQLRLNNGTVGSNSNTCIMTQNNALPTDTWTMITATYNTTHLRLFTNGTEDTTYTTCGGTGFLPSANFANAVLTVLGGTGLGVMQNGSIDEFGIWNRSLTEAEITALYNSGNALQYDKISPAITLNSPADNSKQINPINFNCSLRDINGKTLSNITLYTNVTGNFIANETVNVSGTSNSSNFTVRLPFGTFGWNCYGCNNIGDCDFDTNNRTVIVSHYLEDSITYNSSTNEFARETFILSINRSVDYFSSLEAIFYYNGSSYSSTKTSSGNTYNFTSSIDIPTVVGINTQTKDFHWIIQLTNSTATYSFNTTISNQTVNPIVFKRCDADLTTPIIVNFSIQDEINRSKLNATMDATFVYKIFGSSNSKNYSISTEGNETFAFCTNSSDPTDMFEVDSTINLKATSFDERTYRLEDERYNNVTTQTTLFLLDSDSSSKIIVEVRDAGLQPLEDYLVEIKRYYPDSNEYITVISDKTDEFGQIVSSLVEDTVKYKFIFTNPLGSVVKTTEDITIACRNVFCVIPFVIEDSTDDFQRFDNITSFTSELSFDNSTNIFTANWVDTTGDSIRMRLLVERVLINGTTVVCNLTTTSTSSSLNCDVGDSKASYRSQLYRRVDGGIEKRISVLNVKVGDLSSVFGKEGLIWVFILLFTLIGAFAYNPSAAAIMYMVIFTFMGLLGIISFNIPLFFANLVIVVAFVIAFRS